MEAGLASDEVAIVGEGDTSFGNDGVEVLEHAEVPVDAFDLWNGMATEIAV